MSKYIKIACVTLLTHFVSQINEGESSKSSLTFRSAGIECFDWKSNCFLGGKRLTVDKKHPGRNNKYLKLEKSNPWIL